ncbi:ecdysteroid-phosphate phosphatase isoform X2 [Plodia interpunctella]|uniref:ecdysteroid-phosphate phosphatase isoform X2 n=1 Tax=Plodia interpunctella TaxID=58824 RepID=UPI002367F8AF|nr:protein UBASH3A homolog isoform X2 [Plodia interpunctella]
MKTGIRDLLLQVFKMPNIPPRKVSSLPKASKQDASPLQILLQMGFPRHRALKALAATGNRSVQLASDWLLTHVNDASIDNEEPREYIFYASPSGPLLAQLLDFWEKSKTNTGWNGAHNFPPHITLVSFFKAPDETSLQLAKAVKHVVETVGDPPACPLKLEPYMSQNFMGLFVSEEHADYLKRIAVQYVKQVSSASINLEAHVKSLHITLAYHFEVAAYDQLKALVDGLQPLAQSSWQLRLYSRDPRFNNHQVHKVTQGYSPKASDELELVLGDIIYIEEKEFDSSPDGWVYGTSWLTGVSGYLPAVFTRRTAESDAWTLHRAISLGNTNSIDSKSESDSTDVEMSGAYPHEDAAQLGHEKSEETYKEWAAYWEAAIARKNQDILTESDSADSSKATKGNGDTAASGNDTSTGDKSGRRWYFAMRHGERVDLTYGQWVPFCFDENDTYVRKDLNMPLALGKRAGGRDSYSKDSPLTRIGRYQAYLVGEGLRLAGVPVKHVYASAALRCVETAHEVLQGLQDPSVKIRVEPGLFEYKVWHAAKGLAPFMTNEELHKAGYQVDVDYKPYVDLAIDTTETVEDFYDRHEKVIHSVVKDTEAVGGNVMFVGHAATLDMSVFALKRLSPSAGATRAAYQLSSQLLRVPYAALAAVRDRPWQLVSPPCPPSINSSSGRFDWKILLDAQ